MTRARVAADHVAAQADQRGLRHAAGVVVLAGRRYVAVTGLAGRHALDVLAGTRGIGEQQARLAAIARLVRRRSPGAAAQPIAESVAR